MDLRYAAPAEDVRDLVSIYYHGVVNTPFEGEERAAIAQFRVHLSGEVRATMSDGQAFQIRESSVQGPTTGPIKYELHADSAFVGCGLLPCGWDALVGRSAADHANVVLPLSPLFKTDPRPFEARLIAAGNFDDMVPILDEFARHLKSQVDDNIREFVKLVDMWLMASPSPDVADLYDAIALSSRQIERLVKHLYGGPPKFIARKYRALRAARQIKEEGAPADDAFYDQSHMIRELKHFTGHTPSRIQLDTDELARLIDSRSHLVDQIHPLTAIT